MPAWTIWHRASRGGWRPASSSLHGGGGPDGGGSEPVLWSTGRPEGLPTRPALESARVSAGESPSDCRPEALHRSGRYTRLPLVRQRLNYSEGGGDKSWIIDSRTATCGRSRSTLQHWNSTHRESNVRVKHWRSTVRGSSVSVKASPFDGLRPALEAHTVECHCLKVALHCSRVELHSPTLELHGLSLALHA